MLLLGWMAKHIGKRGKSTKSEAQKREERSSYNDVLGMVLTAETMRLSGAIWTKTVAQRREKEPKKKKRKSNHAQCDTDYTIISISIFLASSYLSYIAEAEEQTLKSNDHTARQSTCCVESILICRHQFKKYISFWYYLVKYQRMWLHRFP